MAIVPDAEQCISYGLPAFRLRGKTTAGFVPPVMSPAHADLTFVPNGGQRTY